MTNKIDTESAIYRIRLVMAVKKLTIRSLSEMTGLPYRSLQDSLAGKYGLKSDALKAISEALGVSADFLLFGVAARLDLDFVKEAFLTLEELKSLSGNKLGEEELSRIFNSVYHDEYTRRFRMILSGPQRRFVESGANLQSDR